MLYRVLRIFLFLFDAETAHCLGLWGLKHFARFLGSEQVEDPVELLGTRFPNRVGLAAGLDKDACCFEALSSLGFGFIEVGTITPVAQPGNPKPRMFRLKPQRAIINRMGFNNLGVDNLVANIRASQFSGVLGINIGKNKNTTNDDALSDYLVCLEKAYPLADYITINISSPNTPDLRELQYGQALRALLGPLKDRALDLAGIHDRVVPLLVKIAPDIETAAIRDIAAAVTDIGLDGIIATNTTLDRDAVVGVHFSSEHGGLSGAPLLHKSTEVIRQLRQYLPQSVPIIGVGGIMTAADAVEKITAGADLVQLYTGFIYAGPVLVRDCALALKQHAQQRSGAGGKSGHPASPV